jgi:hypothetical protein
MRGMSKGINCLRLRFSEFIIVYAFSRLSVGDRTMNLEIYSQKSIASSSRSTTQESTAEPKLGDKLR